MDIVYYLVPFPLDENEGPLRCEDCFWVPNNRKQGVYESRKKLEQHLWRIHRKKPKYQCRVCGEQSQMLRTALNHARQHVALPAVHKRRGRRRQQRDSSSEASDTSDVPTPPRGSPAPARGARRLHHEEEVDDQGEAAAVEDHEVMGDQVEAAAIGDHVRDLLDFTEEVADLRAEMELDIDASRAVLETSVAVGPAASTPVPRLQAERRDEVDLDATLARLTAAAARGDGDAWDVVLNESLRVRRRRRRNASIVSVTSNNGGLR
ncbi:uncharacterized protein LOC129000876 [Macrosteles quadrilineatus]|uniref:uncharacterized protein LOC129000876 n=1 Tax=Macrosteles quadrilineatus TaxID=74068 RepID=UPI0023E2CD90|nr:uncharacterized protein LOC129000876 [Macrosteles quadrilineatus]